MFATDFPHIECEWPNSRSFINKIYADVAEDERDRIWAGNAVEFFKLAATPGRQQAAQQVATSV
jgi:predicted TIM-barrel fold metal-dependent hydrolase